MQQRLATDKLTILINHDGAEICSVKNNSELEYIWQANKNIWGRHAPVLFPIVGKLKDNIFLFEKKEYQLRQHGFARDLSFTLIQKNEKSCTFELKASHTTKKSFPFDFEFQIKYEAAENVVTSTYKVINPSLSPIYFSLGAHPAFNCPLLPGEASEDYYLEFEQKDLLQTTLSEGLRVEKKKINMPYKRLFLNADLFNRDAIVFENSQVSKIVLNSSQSAHKITMLCKNWPYFGIWTKGSSPSFICLEPWFGVADHQSTNQNFAQKAGIICLGAQQEFNCSFSLLFD